MLCKKNVFHFAGSDIAEENNLSTNVLLCLKFAADLNSCYKEGNFVLIKY